MSFPSWSNEQNGRKRFLEHFQYSACKDLITHRHLYTDMFWKCIVQMRLQNSRTLWNQYFFMHIRFYDNLVITFGKTFVRAKRKLGDSKELNSAESAWDIWNNVLFCYPCWHFSFENSNCFMPKVMILLYEKKSLYLCPMNMQ